MCLFIFRSLAVETGQILEHLVWSNTSGFQFSGPLARTNVLSALCGQLSHVLSESICSQTAQHFAIFGSVAVLVSVPRFFGSLRLSFTGGTTQVQDGWIIRTSDILHKAYGTILEPGRFSRPHLSLETCPVEPRRGARDL